MALTAYLQRLGTDIKWKRPAFAPLTIPGASAGPASAAVPAAPDSAAASARQAGQVK